MHTRSLVLTYSRKASNEELQDLKYVGNDANTSEIPTLTTNNAFRDIGYLPNEQNLLCRNAGPTTLETQASAKKPRKTRQETAAKCKPAILGRVSTSETRLAWSVGAADDRSA